MELRQNVDGKQSANNMQCHNGICGRQMPWQQVPVDVGREDVLVAAAARKNSSSSPKRRQSYVLLSCLRRPNIVPSMLLIDSHGGASVGLHAKRFDMALVLAPSLRACWD
jgi:hypothetical protein